MRAFFAALTAATMLTTAPSQGHSHDVVVLDFEDLRHDDTLVRGVPNSRSYGGEIGRDPSVAFTADLCATGVQCFVLTAHHFSPVGNPPRFNVFGTLRDDFPGSTALFHGIGQGEIVLRRVDGREFD